MSNMNKVAKELKKAMTESDGRKPKAYDTEATVTHVDGNTLWVKFPGGETETPVRRTIDAKPGDIVMVRVANHRAWTGGNSTNPPTDDTRANQVGAAAQPSIDFVAELVDKDVTVKSITAATGYIDDLYSKNITTENINAATGYIKDLTSENITAQNIVADHADVNTLKANKADIDLANVNVAWIEQGNIKKAEVFDENVFDLSGNRATLSRIDASKINVANLRADNLVVRRINGQPVVGGYTLISNTSPGYESKNPQELGWYEFVNAQWVLSTDTTVDMTKAYYQEGDEVSLYDQAYIDSLKNDLQQQIDGAVETFTGSVVPTLVNYPYTDWYDTSVTPVHDERAKHVGDIYYVVNSSADEGGYCYRFAFDETNHEYMWVLIKDTDITKALSDISDLQTFESETTSWIDETDQGLETIRTNHTALSGRVDTVETTANNALPAATFESFESTTFTDLVDEVDEQSTTMTNMTTRLGLNADGTQSATDIVAKESALEQTVNGISSRVGKTEMHLAGMYATSSTAAGTAAKVATIVPALSNYELVKGAMVTVKFTAANTTASPTLNLNDTGAKAIKTYSGGNLAKAEYEWKAGSTFTFTYDGTYWRMQDSTASVRMTTAETEIQQTADNVLIKATRSGASAAEKTAGGTSAIGLINVSPDNVVIAAKHVDIAGAAVFNNYSTTTQMNSAISGAVNGIEIGGRNLVLNTGTMPTSGGGHFRPSGTVVSHIDITQPPAGGITGGIRVTNTTSSPMHVGFAQDSRNNTFVAGEKYTMSCWIRASTTMTHDVTLQPIWISGAQVARTVLPQVPLTTSWQKIYAEGLVLSGEQTDSYSCGYVYVDAVPPNEYFEVCGLKVEQGNKVTDWSPAPEDVQAEIDAKTSIKILESSYAAGFPYRDLLTYAKEGRTNADWAVTDASKVEVGDICRISVKVRDFTDAYAHVIGQLTSKNGNTVYMTMQGLDSTIIDGGKILTNSVGANQIDANSINASNSLTVGAFSTATQNSVLNSNISVGGKNIAMTTNARIYSTSYNCAQIPICERLEAGVTYTFQMWGVSVNNTNTGTNWIRTFWGGGNNGLGVEGLPDSNGYYCTTFTVSSTAASRDPDSWHWYIYIYNSDKATARNFTVKKWKLERGNKPTDWSPCPADTKSGENLIRGTRDMMNGSGSYGTGTFRASGGTLGHVNFSTNNPPPVPELKGYISITNNTSSATNIGIAQDGIYDKAIVGKHYVQSCWVTCNSTANNCRFYFQPWYTANSYLSGSINIKLNSAIWQYVEFSGMLNGTQQSGYSGGYAYGYQIPPGGTIYIAGLKVEEGTVGTGWTPAREEADASTYITQIDSNGIRIHPSSTQNNSVVINANGMEVFKGGTGTANSVAFYGDTARIGKDSTQRVEITSSVVSLYDSNNKERTQVNTSGLLIKNAAGNTKASIYDTITLYGGAGTYPLTQITSSNVKIAQNASNYANVNSNGLQVYQGGSEVASFGSTARIGPTNSYNIQVGTSTIDFYKNGTRYCKLESTTSGTLFGYYGVSSSSTTYGNWMYFGASSSPYIHFIVGNGSSNSNHLYLETSLYWSNHIRIPNNHSYRGTATNGDPVSMLYVSSSNTINIGNSSYDVYVNSKTFSGNKSYSTSDLRLKRDIKYLDNRSYDLIMRLRPFEFSWDRSNDKSLAEGKCFGLGAQDVDKAMTEVGYKTSDYGVVGKTPDGHYAVSYTELIPHLINAVQKQHNEIEYLKSMIKEAC